MQYNFYPTPNGLLKPLSRKEPSIPFDILNIVSDTTGINFGQWSQSDTPCTFRINFTTAAPKDMYLHFEYLQNAVIFGGDWFTRIVNQSDIPIKISLNSFTTVPYFTNGYYTNLVNYVSSNFVTGNNSANNYYSADMDSSCFILGNPLSQPASANDALWCDMSYLIKGWGGSVSSSRPTVDLSTASNIPGVEYSYSIVIPKGITNIDLSFSELHAGYHCGIQRVFTTLFSITSGTTIPDANQEKFVFGGLVWGPKPVWGPN